MEFVEEERCKDEILELVHNNFTFQLTQRMSWMRLYSGMIWRTKTRNSDLFVPQFVNCYGFTKTNVHYSLYHIPISLF